MTPTSTIPVSVVVMTRNEAANIGACLASLRDFEDIVVVDSDSEDGTAALAESAGVRVVRFRWNGRYPKKKQWCLETLELRHSWVLFVDADERVTPGLVRELAGLFQGADGPAACFVPSRPVMFGRVLRFGARYEKIALVDRRRARFVPCPDLHVETMWEVEGHYQPQVDGPIGRLRSPLLHDDAKPPHAWFERHNRYSDWEARVTQVARHGMDAAEPWRRRLAKAAFARLPARPLAVFLHAYVLRLGFLDGQPGWHHAVGRAFYYWQVDYKRAWKRTSGPPGPDVRS